MSPQQDITNYWEHEVCGTRFTREKITSRDRALEIASARYNIENYIPTFAGFNISNLGIKVLEIGVGAGADFIQWVGSGADCYGIDVTEAAINETLSNLQHVLGPDERSSAKLQLASAEKLPFKDDFFDIVYSHGVLHHAERTMKCISEAVRVLKPGGKLKIMVYSTFSATGIMLWIVHGLLKGRPLVSQEQIIYEKLESPGTKCYSRQEISKILRGFGLSIDIVQKFANAGDLLLMPPSKKHKSCRLYALAQYIYPRFIIRRFQKVLGLAMIVIATK